MNKPRLIDANELIEALRESHKHHANNSKEESLLMRDIAILNEQPTAYDIDKVVEQLEEELKTYVDASNIFVQEIYDGMVFGMEKAIEIVKKGGCK
jgi:hypothetical protein